MLIHNGRLANPLDPFAKQLHEVTSIRGKTDNVQEEIARLEWLGGMYTDCDGDPCLPGELIEATIRAGARKSKLGKQFLAGVSCDDTSKIEYDGPKDLSSLYADDGHRLSVMVKVGTSKVLRTRPKFDSWEVEFTLRYDPEIVRKEELDRAVKAAGAQCGFGTWRPKFGRFDMISVADGNSAGKTKKTKTARH